MDLRNKIKIDPIKRTDITLQQLDYEEYDDYGNTTKSYYYPKNPFTLEELINHIKSLNIPESEYNNITIAIKYDDRYSVYFISVVYNRPKSEQEMQTEKDAILKEREAKIKDKENKKKEKDKKKEEKQKIIDSLTPEQKKVLGIK